MSHTARTRLARLKATFRVIREQTEAFDEITNAVASLKADLAEVDDAAGWARRRADLSELRKDVSRLNEMERQLEARFASADADYEFLSEEEQDETEDELFTLERQSRAALDRAETARVNLERMERDVHQCLPVILLFRQVAKLAGDRSELKRQMKQDVVKSRELLGLLAPNVKSLDSRMVEAAQEIKAVLQTLRARDATEKKLHRMGLSAKQTVLTIGKDMRAADRLLEKIEQFQADIERLLPAEPIACSFGHLVRRKLKKDEIQEIKSIDRTDPDILDSAPGVLLLRLQADVEGAWFAWDKMHEKIRAKQLEWEENFAILEKEFEPVRVFLATGQRPPRFVNST